MRYPEFLKENGTIGFVAPSFGAATEPYKSQFVRALENFEKEGYQTDPGPNVFAGDGIGISSTPENCGKELTDAKKARYIEQMGLPEYDTQIICSSPALIRVFERTAEICGKPKIAANWVMGEMMKNLKENGIEADDISFNIDSLGKIINMLEKNKISRNNAKKVFKEVVLNDVDPDAFVKENSLEILTDNSAIESVINEVIASNTKSVEEYKAGKEKAIQFLVGQSMKALRGAAPAQEIIKLLKEKLG